MKELKEFIIEKLQINSKSKIKVVDRIKEVPNITDNYVVNKLLYVWGIANEECSTKFLRILTKWVTKNHVIDVQPAADQETLNSIKEYMPDEITKLYDSSSETNEICQDKLTKAKCLWTFDEYGLDIYASEEIIAFIGHEGTLYCLPQ